MRRDVRCCSGNHGSQTILNLSPWRAGAIIVSTTPRFHYGTRSWSSSAVPLVLLAVVLSRQMLMRQTQAGASRAAGRPYTSAGPGATGSRSSRPPEGSWPPPPFMPGDQLRLLGLLYALGIDDRPGSRRRRGPLASTSPRSFGDPPHSLFQLAGSRLHTGRRRHRRRARLRVIIQAVEIAPPCGGLPPC